MTDNNPASGEPSTISAVERALGSVKDPLIGKSVGNGRYVILDLLGRGGMSVVYKARQELVDRIVAIKTLKMQLLSEPVVMARFEREVKTLSKLNHPNIVTVFDCIVENGHPYVVMDCLSGMTLQDLLRADGPMHPFRVRNIFLQVLSAIEHAHKNAVIHRDLKPGNIIIDNADGGEAVKVVDFGLAKLGSDAQRLTQTGEVWGSPMYLSPEQATSSENDARCDIYSLGIVMYEALTGAPPFHGRTALETIEMQISAPPPAMRQINAAVKVPPALEQMVLRCLEKNPDQRFQTATAARQALSEIEIPRPSEAELKSSLPAAARTAHTATKGTKYGSARPTAKSRKGKGPQPFLAPLIAIVLLVQAAVFFFKEVIPARNLVNHGGSALNGEQLRAPLAAPQPQPTKIQPAPQPTEIQPAPPVPSIRHTAAPPLAHSSNTPPKPIATGATVKKPLPRPTKSLSAGKHARPTVKAATAKPSQKGTASKPRGDWSSLTDQYSKGYQRD